MTRLEPVSDKTNPLIEFNTRDLLLAQPWSHAFFTTYALSLSFFEAVMLEALSRSRSKAGSLTILVDALGLRSALGETGARKIGRDYLVEPVLVKNGIFHPKISVLATASHDVHLIVGSGNIIFGGWGGNFESIEHLHSTFAASAFRDTAAFLETMASDPRLTHGAGEACIKTSELLLKSVRNVQDNGHIRVLHSLDVSIMDQLIDQANELGGAQRVTVASPYYDGGAAVRALLNGLGLPKAHLHCHPNGAVKGSFGTGWPSALGDTIVPVCINDVVKLDGSVKSQRLLHAKMFEIVCASGRLIVSGSANATMPALGKQQNVEACVLRILPSTTVSWVLMPSLAPGVEAQEPIEAENQEDAIGILRAISEGNIIRGQVLSSKPRGRCQLFPMAGENTLNVVETVVGAEGKFEAVVPDLMNEFFKANRIVVELRGLETAHSASGFLSIVDYVGVMGRLGPHGRVMADLLAGRDTPEDVIIILEWVLQNLGDLKYRFPSDGTKTSKPVAQDTRVITAAMFEASSTEINFNDQNERDSKTENWQRFMEFFLAAIRSGGTKARSIDVDIHEDDIGSNHLSTNSSIPNNISERTRRAIEETLSELLDNDATDEADKVKHCMLAWDLLRFTFCRGDTAFFQPDPYLRRIAARGMRLPMSGDTLEVTAAISILLNGDKFGSGSAVRVRRDMLKLGWNLADGPPNLESVLCFDPNISAAIWDQVLEVRAPFEVMAAIEHAANSRLELPNIDFLVGTADAEMREIIRIIGNPRLEKQFVFSKVIPRGCPKCSMAFSKHERDNLEAYSCTIHVSSRCGRVLMITGVSESG